MATLVNSRLTPSERILLERLARSTLPVTTEQLLQTLWQSRDEPDGSVRTVRTHLMNLRRKIAFTGLVITNQPYVGYKLKV